MNVESKSEKDRAYRDPRQFHVVEQSIRCGKEVILPPVCVVTGDRVSIELLNQSFFYRPIYLAVLGPICWLVYAVFRHNSQTCRVSYFVSNRIVERNRWLKIAGWSLFVAAIVTFWYGLTMSTVDLTPLPVGLGLLTVGAVALSLSQSPLTLASFDGHGVFMLAGFSSAFCDAAYAYFEEKRANMQAQREAAAALRGFEGVPSIQEFEIPD
jgi:hypothetical protein